MAWNFFIGTSIVFILGSILLSSFEWNTNCKINDLQKDITAIESSIDALEMEKQNLASFSRLEKVATKSGLVYEQDSVVATIKGEDNN